MATKFSYPRVTISSKALPHTSVAPATEDTTVLFMPLLTEKGPEYQITPVHSLSELTEIFGDLDYMYKANGQGALNTYNWLTNGGTVYVCRLIDEDYISDKINNKASIKVKDSAETGSTTLGFAAKYSGEYYNTLKVKCSATINGHKFGSNNPIFDLEVIQTVNGQEVVVERFYRLNMNNIKSVLKESQYIEYCDDTVGGDPTPGDSFELPLRTAATATIENKLEELIYTFYTAAESNTNSAKYLLRNHLETPIDIIMDAGYGIGATATENGTTTNYYIKDAIWNFVTENRPDIVVILDKYSHSTINDLIEKPVGDYVIENTGTNLAIYEQYFTTNSVLDNGVSIYVTPSYFLSRLIPYNDRQYGVQYATAGLRRGVLSDATYINENPIPDKKENWFKSRINYVEKTSREYSFQSQRTHDGSSEIEYTALSFLNNVRAFHLMKKELERLGRDYLFEFNDSMTLANLSNVLNRYMTQWVSNRTLSSAAVDVRKNPYSDEAVDITMSIRFTGTIEVISVDITIE